jgi:inorganic triphosphatase YgiF
MPRTARQPATPGDKETELKLALPTDEPAELLRRLSHTTVLNRRKPVQQQLHNIYFDTPTQQLRHAQAALRLRRVDTGGEPRWVQTLKTGAAQASALSRRGEWEATVAGAALQADSLDAGAWKHIDPDGSVFGALAPCFVTDFARTIWLVRQRDGSEVEVALDIGSVTQAGRSAPICELELELKAGPVTALFDIAEKIAASVPVLPTGMSKAQRGYALATDTLAAPTAAAPPRLSRAMHVSDTARLVLREMFGQFTANLNAVRHADDPEVVHQARVGWRRLRSARRLFKSVLPADGQPDWTVLKPLLAFLGDLRDLDVARTETLPPLREAYVAGSDDRAQAWDATMLALKQAGHVQRTAVRHALQDPALGLCLLQATRWLEPATTQAHGPGADDRSLKGWAERHASRLHARLQRASKTAHDAQSLHRVRLLAKRTRYSIEALRGVLPPRMRRKWYPVAVDLQKSIGAERDFLQAIGLLERVEARPDLITFLRGVAAGRSQH